MSTLRRLILMLACVCLVIVLLLGAQNTASESQILKFCENDHLNSSAEYFTATSGCIDKFYKTRTVQGNPPRYCRLNNLDVSASHLIARRKCSYLVINIKFWEYSFVDTDLKVEIQLVSSCSNDGSTFTVYFTSDDAQHRRFIWCETQYSHTEGLYTLTCPIPKESVTACGTLNVQLDFEDYNAFQEHTPQLPLSLPIEANVSLSICPSHFKFVHSEPRQQRKADPLKCLTQYPLYLIGSSHMRYVWDALVDKYLDGGHDTLLSLPQHHGDASVGQVHFINNLFILQLPALLNNICKSIHETIGDPYNEVSTARDKWRIVMQSLSWDLDFHPVRNALLYNGSVPALVNAIKRLAAQPCGRYMELTWVTAVPVPPCNASSSTDNRGSVGNNRRQTAMVCSAESRGYRNNHAIAAANQYIVGQLNSITIERRNGKRRVVQPFLSVVDAFQLIYPTHSQSVCGLHYTCAQRKGKKPLQSVEILHTLGGNATIDRVLSSVCV